MSESKPIHFNSLREEFEHSGKYRLLLSEADIQRRVRELGRQISKDYQHKCPVLIGVLNGSFLFFADLVRELTIDCEVDFFKISSYGSGTQSTGEIRLKKDIDCHLKDKDVIVVEDIVDSGQSVRYLDEKIKRMQPKSLRFVSLLVKWDNARPNRKIDYVGFSISREFVVGYGLDINQKLRNLKDIYIYNEVK